MDLIIDLIDQLIEARIRSALDPGGWGGHDNKAAVLKERIRRLLNENIQTK